MAGPTPSSLDYLSVDDVLTLHSFVVEGDEVTEPGVANRGAIEYAVETVRQGHFGERPESIHEVAFQLMRLLVSNHPFVDGNKRTALLSTVAFYALNGYEFEYDRDVKTTLKAFATDAQSVDEESVLEHFASNTTHIPHSQQSESIGDVLRRQFRRRRYNADDDESNR